MAAFEENGQPLGAPSLVLEVEAEEEEKGQLEETELGEGATARDMNCRLSDSMRRSRANGRQPVQAGYKLAPVSE